MALLRTVRIRLGPPWQHAGAALLCLEPPTRFPAMNGTDGMDWMDDMDRGLERETAIAFNDEV